MSSAWRSFLTRSRPLLFSSLRPVRRHGNGLTTVFGRSKGYASDSCDDATQKRHLYVVLDDQKDGFGVHKLDLSDNDHTAGTRRLKEPPALHVTLTTLGERAQFAAVGSSIVAVGTTVFSPMLRDHWMPDYMGGVLIYDTKTSAVTVAPHLPSGLVSGYTAAVAVENSLYMLGSERPYRDWNGGGGGSLHCLTTDPSVDHDVSPFEDKFWGWEPVSDFSPWWWSDYDSPPGVPILAKYITAHAADASQHEIFVSVKPTERSVLGATFSFSRASSKWTWLGGWQLPVLGQAHYDGHLDAWIGLHAVDSFDEEYGSRVMDGYLCAGKIRSNPMWWEVGEEKLFRLDEDAMAGWRHVDAKLVPIESSDGCSQYCLMERLRLEVDDGGEEEKDKTVEEEEEMEGTVEKKCWGDGGRSVLRLTTFRVDRGNDGKPIATPHLPARSYEVPWHNRDFDAQAFWM
ncbi:unnamed protein product [Alopecurus aequalis]